MHDVAFSRKIVSPALPSVILHRQALVERLQEAIVGGPQREGTASHYKLVLCCAPAGYGKTTLLADFARSTTTTCCWYFLDHADTDPVVFLLMLLASLRAVFPHFGQRLDPLFHNLFTQFAVPASGIFQTAIDALCLALAVEISEPVVLFLCNYEEINESENLTELVNSLLKKLPSQVTLVIESRVMPDIDLARFLVYDEIGGLNSAALRFSASEIAELARLQGLTTLTDVEAEHLAISFDGWITGILLGTRLGDLRFLLPEQHADVQNTPLPREEYSVLPKSRNLFTYIASEVFKRDATVYTFLQPASILQEMEPGMCNTLFARTDAAERLAHLEQQGLFVTSYESASHVVYVCHPVIRDLLREQFRQSDPERFRALHRQAAELWRSGQNYEQAMYHAGEAGAHELQAELILEASRQFLGQGKLETLARWLRILPIPTLEGHPRLLLIQATLALAYGQHSSVLPLLERAAALIPSADAVETRVLQAEIDILRGNALCQAGEYPRARFLCEQALLQLPDAELELRAAAEMRLGMCFNLQGNFSGGMMHLQQALHVWADQPPPNQAIEIHTCLANTYYLIGNFALAEHHLTHALDFCEQMYDSQGKVDNLILRGILAQHQGAYPEAEEALLQALSLARASSHVRCGEAYALTNLGALYLEQGLYALALRSTEDGLAIAHQWGNRSLANAALANLAMIHLFMDDPVSALLYVEKMEVQESNAQVVGYEWTWRELTYGMIILSQGRYTEAHACLAAVEAALNTMDWKSPLFQAKLRLAACLFAQNRPEDSVRLLAEVASLLATARGYTHLVLLELRWLPALLPIVQQHPQLAPLRRLLALDEPVLQWNANQQSLTGLAVAGIYAPALTIQAFGEPAVLLDGQPVKHWRMARAMELFFFLLDQEHPVSKESILTALWPEFDDQTNQTFHSTLHHLRALLGETCVIFGSSGYGLNLVASYGEQIFYDIKAFRQYHLVADEALAQKNEAGARGALLKMVELYRGDYGRPFYNDWCTFRRDELRAVYLDARRQLARIAWRAGAWNESVENFHHMLLLDNCLEEAHYGLMRCYVRQGKRGDAVRQYQSCQKILQQELGVQPSPVLQTLYQHLTAK